MSSDFSHHRFAGEADYRDMLAMLSAASALTRGPRACTSCELEWWRFHQADPTAAIAGAELWRDRRGGLIAYAWPDRGGVDLALHPRAAQAADEVLGWAEAWSRAAGEAASQVECATGEERLRAALLRRGYAVSRVSRAWRRRSLAGAAARASASTSRAPRPRHERAQAQPITGGHIPSGSRKALSVRGRAPSTDEAS
jgi:hypothetical protein